MCYHLSSFISLASLGICLFKSSSFKLSCLAFFLFSLFFLSSLAISNSSLANFKRFTLLFTVWSNRVWSFQLKTVFDTYQNHITLSHWFIHLLRFERGCKLPRIVIHFWACRSSLSNSSLLPSSFFHFRLFFELKTKLYLKSYCLPTFFLYFWKHWSFLFLYVFPHILFIFWIHEPSLLPPTPTFFKFFNIWIFSFYFSFNRLSFSQKVCRF